MLTNWCVFIEISMEIGMLNFWLGLLVTALMKVTYFRLQLFTRRKRLGQKFCHLQRSVNSTLSDHLLLLRWSFSEKPKYLVFYHRTKYFCVEEWLQRNDNCSCIEDSISHPISLFKSNSPTCVRLSVIRVSFEPLCNCSLELGRNIGKLGRLFLQQSPSKN